MDDRKINTKPQLISLTHNTDFRGSTSILYDRQLSEQLNFNLIQVNQGYSKSQFTLRGLHFQESPHEQAKLVYITVPAPHLHGLLAAPSRTFSRTVTEL